VGDGGHRVAFRVGGLQLTVGMVEPDPAQVARGGGVQVTAEGQLHGADGDAGGGRDVGQGDVLVRPGGDERDRAPQRGRGGVVPVRGGRLGQGVVGERGQRGGGEKPGRAGRDQRRVGRVRAGQEVAQVVNGGRPLPGGRRGDGTVAGKPDRGRPPTRRGGRDL